MVPIATPLWGSLVLNRRPNTSIHRDSSRVLPKDSLLLVYPTRPVLLNRCPVLACATLSRCYKIIMATPPCRSHLFVRRRGLSQALVLIPSNQYSARAWNRRPAYSRVPRRLLSSPLRLQQKRTKPEACSGFGFLCAGEDLNLHANYGLRTSSAVVYQFLHRRIEAYSFSSTVPKICSIFNLFLERQITSFL